MSEPVRISAAELTHAAFSGVIAAMKEHDVELHKFPGPILAGIIAWPELSQRQLDIGRTLQERASG